jgi:hypothetical protein
MLRLCERQFLCASTATTQRTKRKPVPVSTFKYCTLLMRPLADDMLDERSTVKLAGPMKCSVTCEFVRKRRNFGKP